VGAGLERDAAYRIVQRDARAAWAEDRDLRAVLEDDPEVTLSAAALDDAFDLGRSLRHSRRVLEALDALDGPA
jgi:adenylosuccinate lyase